MATGLWPAPGNQSANAGWRQATHAQRKVHNPAPAPCYSERVLQGMHAGSGAKARTCHVRYLLQHVQLDEVRVGAAVRLHGSRCRQGVEGAVGLG